MSTTIINGQEIEAVIVGEDRASIEESLSESELEAFCRLDNVLRSHPEFQDAYPNARQVRVDFMRDIEDEQEGRYYLRYQDDDNSTELWGNIDENRSIVSRESLARSGKVDCSI